jgi:PAS domain S-box-containing protein
MHFINPGAGLHNISVRGSLQAPEVTGYLMKTAALPANEALRLAAILENLDSEIHIFDAESLKYLYLNTAARRNLGYTEEEIARMTPRDVRANWAEGELQSLLEPLRSGQEQQLAYETRLIRKDRSTYPVEVRLQLWRDGSIPAFISIVNDITVRKAHETALRESESRFRAIASNTPGMVFQGQWGADETLRFSYVSEGCLQVLGLSVEALLGDPSLLQETVLAEDRDAFMDSVRKSAASLGQWNWEGRLWMERYHDVKWVSLRASPRSLEGGGVVWEGIISNITKSKQTETELAASREQLRSLSAHIMAAREQERTRLAREIHDDLGGNLSAIKFVLNWLAQRVDANQPEVLERVRSASAVVDRSMQAAQQIARDLRPAILDCGIVAAVQWQAEEFRKRMGMRCEVICSEAEITLQPEVAVAVFRILQEALTNVAKHARASRVQIHLQLRARVLDLQVIDNGRGIEQEALSIANAFGIRGMMERSDYLSGKLSVSRAPGAGTVVRLTVEIDPETHNQQGTDLESSYR